MTSRSLLTLLKRWVACSSIPTLHGLEVHTPNSLFIFVKPADFLLCLVFRWLTIFDIATDSGQSLHLTVFSLQSWSSWFFTSCFSDLPKVHPSYLQLILGSF